MDRPAPAADTGQETSAGDAVRCAAGIADGEIVLKGGEPITRLSSDLDQRWGQDQYAPRRERFRDSL